LIDDDCLSNDKTAHELLLMIRDGAAVVNEYGILMGCNEPFLRLTGFSYPSIAHKSITNVLPDLEVMPGRLHLRGTDLEYGQHYLSSCVNASRQRRLVGLTPIQSRNTSNQLILLIHDEPSYAETSERNWILAKAIEKTPAGILVIDSLGVVEYANPSVTRLTGYDSERIMGRPFRAITDIFQTLEVEQSFWHAYDHQESWVGEFQEMTKDSIPYVAAVSLTPIKDDADVTTHYLLRLTEITQQKNDQMALIESQTRFQQMARMVGEWLWEQNQEGIYTYSSEAVEDVLGFRPEEMIGQPYRSFLTMEDQRDPRHSLAMATKSNLAFRKQLNHYRHKDGHEVFTESTGHPLVDQSGRIIGWRGIEQDVTERKRVEDALKLRERAIEAVSVGIAIADARAPDFRITYVNPALCDLTAYPKEELLSSSFFILHQGGIEPAVRQHVLYNLKHGLDSTIIMPCARKNRESFWSEMTISPVLDGSRVVTHYIAVVTDITDRITSEKARQELVVARNIQMSLLPSGPIRVQNVLVAGMCEPAALVGGDYYDVLTHGDYVDFVIADVSGHSVGAALIMTEMRSSLRAELRRQGEAPPSTAEMLSILNESLLDDLLKSERFITMFYLRLNTLTKALSYANAGHNPPLLLKRSSSECLRLDSDGLILGVERNVVFNEEQLMLQSGDLLLLYTDGVTECRNEQGDFFDVDRLCVQFIELRDHPPEAMVEKLSEILRQFHGVAAYEDDVTMLAVRVDGDGQI